VPGLRYRREKGGICLYHPGMPASILLAGFNSHWWDRAVNHLAPDYDLLQPKPDWTPEERAAYAALAASPCDPPSIYSPLLHRIRATAGPGPVNSTDAWHAVGGNVRLEKPDGPPCPTSSGSWATAPPESPACSTWPTTAAACPLLVALRPAPATRSPNSGGQQTFERRPIVNTKRLKREHHSLMSAPAGHATRRNHGHPAIAPSAASAGGRALDPPPPPTTRSLPATNPKSP